MTNADDNGEQLTLEEKCAQLMTHVVHMRKTYPSYFQKVNDHIIKLEKHLIEKQYKNTLKAIPEPEKSCPYFDSKFAESSMETIEINRKTHSKLDDRLGKIARIMEQVRNDEIHNIHRAPLDIETILTRAKRRQND